MISDQSLLLSTIVLNDYELLVKRLMLKQGFILLPLLGSTIVSPTPRSTCSYSQLQQKSSMRREVCSFYNKTLHAFEHVDTIFVDSDAITLDDDETLSVNGDEDLNQRLVGPWHQ